MTHLVGQTCNQLADCRLREAQICVAVTYSTAQDSADNVASLGICGQLTIGNRERNSTQVVGNNAHSNISLLILAVSLASHSGDAGDCRLEYVGVVVRLLALQSHTQTLEAHTRINVLCGQRLQLAIGLAVELHEHKVPDLDNQRVAHINHLATGLSLNLLVVTQVDVNLAAGTAGASLTHLPEVVVLVTADNVILGQILLPELICLSVEGNTILLATLEYGSIEAALVQTINACEQFPCPLDSLLLEVIAERPVTEHLEHGVVISIVTYLLQVVVLTRHTQTLLRIGCTRVFARSIAQEDILKLVHTGVGKHQRRVALYDHRSRRHNGMLLRSEEVQKGLANFI